MKEILKDKSLVSKYVVLIFAVINSLLNLFGVQTIPDEAINNLATSISSIVAMWMLLSVRSHEITNLRDSHKEELHNVKKGLDAHADQD